MTHSLLSKQPYFGVAIEIHDNRNKTGQPFHSNFRVPFTGNCAKETRNVQQNGTRKQTIF